jgi:hypothetical protein
MYDAVTAFEWVLALIIAVLVSIGTNWWLGAAFIVLTMWIRLMSLRLGGKL